MNKDNSRNYYLYGLYAVAGTMALPWDHLFYIPLLIAWFYQYRKTFPNIIKSREAILCILFFLMFLIGLTYTEDFYHGLAGLEKRYFWIINLWLLTGVVYLSDKERKSVFEVFAWGIVAVLIFCIMIAVYRTVSMGGVISFDEKHSVYENNFLYHKLSGNVGIHAIVLSVYVAFAFHILYQKIRAVKSGSKEWIILFISLCFLFICVFLLQSATIIAAFSVSLFILLGQYYYQNPSQRRRILIFGTLTGIVFVLFSSFFIVRKLDFKKSIISYCIEDPPDAFNGLNLRLALWWSSGHIVRDYFWTGVGTGDLNIVLDEYYENLHFHYAKRDNLHSHNQYIHTPSLVGIFGLLLLISILASGLYRSFTNRNLLFFLFLFVFICHGITEASLTSNKGIMYFTFFYFLWVYPYDKRLIKTE